MQFGMGKSNAKIFVKPTNGIKFSDVAGEDEAKDSLQEVVEYLHDPTKYRDIGAKMPKGILLVGPPGTGKTYRGSVLICDHVEAGRSVGVTAHSHAVIANLLKAVRKEGNSLQ